MAVPTSAEMVDALKKALASGAAVVSVSIDGSSTTFGREQALKELQFWERRAAREAGTLRTATSFDLSNCW